MNDIVVTGTHGFIGTHVLDKLLKRLPQELGLPQKRI